MILAIDYAQIAVGVASYLERNVLLMLVTSQLVGSSPCCAQRLEFFMARYNSFEQGLLVANSVHLGLISASFALVGPSKSHGTDIYFDFARIGPD